MKKIINQGNSYNTRHNYKKINAKTVAEFFIHKPNKRL